MLKYLFLLHLSFHLNIRLSTAPLYTVILKFIMGMDKYILSFSMHSADSAILHNHYVENVTLGSWCPTADDISAGTAYIQVIIYLLLW